MTPAPACSRKVRRILALEGRARRLARRYDRLLDRAIRTRAQGYRLVEQARGIEWGLTGGQLAELRRAREARQGTHPTIPQRRGNTPG